MPILKPGDILVIDNKVYEVTAMDKFYDDYCTMCDIRRNQYYRCNWLRNPKTRKITSCLELIGKRAVLKEVKEGV